MTARKDLLTTEKRLVTSGETDGIHPGRPETGCEGLAPRRTVPVRNTIPSYDPANNSPRVFREAGRMIDPVSRIL